jgi:hypothetical protein
VNFQYVADESACCRQPKKDADVDQIGSLKYILINLENWSFPNMVPPVIRVMDDHDLESYGFRARPSWQMALSWSRRSGTSGGIGMLGL